jgi:hypothetical protein
MERSREYEDLAAALAVMRPAPRTEFVAELDARVTAGFPRVEHVRSSHWAALMTRLRSFLPRRLAVATGGAAVAAIVAATVIFAAHNSSPGPVALDSGSAGRPHHAQYSAPAAKAAGQPRERSTEGAHRDSSAIQSSDALSASSGSERQRVVPSELPASSTNATLIPRGRTPHRAIECSAEVGLLADPGDVAEDSAKVFSAVHDAGGIVLHSATTAGSTAGAHFDLLIPSAKLGDALAAFSAIDEVSSRHEATDDITAPTVAAGEELQDSRARIDSLLSQLAAAETESERQALEIELRGERRQAAALRSQLTRLHRRAHFSRVSVRIESGPGATSGGAWGFDDAIGDAGRILAIAAGVTVVGLALLAPLALICLLAWLTRRTWLRRARDRALA